MRIAALLVALAAAAAVPASAADYPARDVGNWTVAVSRDGQGCFLTRTYDEVRGTTLLLGLDRDGSHRLSVLNGGWSIRSGERRKLDFRLSNGGYADHPVVGIASKDKQGFVTSFDVPFPSFFATSRALHIDRGTVPVERLSLEGSGAAIAELRRCVGLLGARPAASAREQRRSDRIPEDPFAKVARAGRENSVRPRRTASIHRGSGTAGP